jgi:hypothetical protein
VASTSIRSPLLPCCANEKDLPKSFATVNVLVSLPSIRMRISALKSAPDGDTVLAGCADHTANPAPHISIATVAIPTRRTHGRGIGDLSCMTLSFRGWENPQWQDSGACGPAMRVLSIASPYARRDWGWAATTA